MTKKLQNYINGKLVDSASSRFGSVFNPALGAEASQVPSNTVRSRLRLAKQAMRLRAGANPALQEALEVDE